MLPQQTARTGLLSLACPAGGERGPLGSRHGCHHGFCVKGSCAILGMRRRKGKPAEELASLEGIFEEAGGLALTCSIQACSESSLRKILAQRVTRAKQ